MNEGASKTSGILEQQPESRPWRRFPRTVSGSNGYGTQPCFTQTEETVCLHSKKTQKHKSGGNSKNWYLLFIIPEGFCFCEAVRDFQMGFTYRQWNPTVFQGDPLQDFCYSPSAREGLKCSSFEFIWLWT